MKKFELNLDALIVIAAIFLLAIGFIVFQRYQYSVLLQDHIDLAWDKENVDVNFVLTSRLLEKCQNEQVSRNESGMDGESPRPAE